MTRSTYYAIRHSIRVTFGIYPNAAQALRINNAMIATDSDIETRRERWYFYDYANAVYQARAAK